jgi:hypothetical protein
MISSPEIGSRRYIHMRSVVHQTPQEKAVPLIYRLHRWLFAVCIVLGPLTMSLWFGLCPQFGDPGCPNGGASPDVYVAFRTMNPQLMQAFLFITLLTPYVFPLSYLGLGLLAMKRSPWWATVGIAFGLVGSLPFGGVVAAQISLIYGMAQMSYNPIFATIEQHFPNWMISTLGVGWGLGHQLGYVLLGVALLRARVIPLWAACLIIVSAPVMGPIAYGTNLGLLQVFGFVLVLIGSVPAAIVMLNKRNEPEPAEVSAAEVAPII